MQRVLDYLKKNPIFYLATCDGDHPHVRPFGAIAFFEGKLYIITNNMKKCYYQMITNSNVELCTMGEDGSWLRIEARAVHDHRREARVEMMKQNEELLSKMYDVDDDLMEVFYLEEATATFCSFMKPAEIVTF